MAPTRSQRKIHCSEVEGATKKSRLSGKKKTLGFFLMPRTFDIHGINGTENSEMVDFKITKLVLPKNSRRWINAHSGGKCIIFKRLIYI